MLQYGDPVKIVYSKALFNAELCELVGRKANVVRPNRINEKVVGYYVNVLSGRYAGQEVLVPIQSIESVETINRYRSIAILKNTVL